MTHTRYFASDAFKKLLTSLIRLINHIIDHFSFKNKKFHFQFYREQHHFSSRSYYRHTIRTGLQKKKTKFHFLLALSADCIRWGRASLENASIHLTYHTISLFLLYSNFPHRENIIQIYKNIFPICPSSIIHISYFYYI